MPTINTDSPNLKLTSSTVWDYETDNGRWDELGSSTLNDVVPSGDNDATLKITNSSGSTITVDVAGTGVTVTPPASNSIPDGSSKDWQIAYDEGSYTDVQVSGSNATGSIPNATIDFSWSS